MMLEIANAEVKLHSKKTGAKTTKNLRGLALMFFGFGTTLLLFHGVS